MSFSTPGPAQPPGAAANAATGSPQTGLASVDQRPPQYQAIEKLLAIPAMEAASPQKACDVFLKSEQFYVEHAIRVVCELEIRLRNHIVVESMVLTEEEIAYIFLNVSQIYEFNRKLYKELLNIRLEGRLFEELGNIMVKHIPFFKLYTAYVRGYRAAQVIVEKIALEKKKFAKFLRLNELCVGLPLRVLLLAPVTRLPQYLVYLGAIARNIADLSSEPAQRLLGAIREIQKVTHEISLNLRDEVARKLVVRYQKEVFGDSVDLISPHRFVVKHGDLFKLYNKSSRHMSDGKKYIFILFNDMLLYGTRNKKFSSGAVKHILVLASMSVGDVADDNMKIRNGIKLTSDTKSFIVCAPTHEEKIKWTTALKEQCAIAATNAASLKKSQQSGEIMEKIIKKKFSMPSWGNSTPTNSSRALPPSSPTSNALGIPQAYSVGFNGQRPSYTSSPPSPGPYTAGGGSGGYSTTSSSSSYNSGDGSNGGAPEDGYVPQAPPGPPMSPSNGSGRYPPPTPRPPPPAPPMSFSSDYESYSQPPPPPLPGTGGSGSHRPPPPAPPGPPPTFTGGYAPPTFNRGNSSSSQKEWNSGPSINDQLKESLDRYRQFVQDEEDGIAEDQSPDEWNQ